jgi:hypothetical protein
MDELTIEQGLAEWQEVLSNLPDGTAFSLKIYPNGGEITEPIKKCCKIVNGMFIRIRCDSADVYKED